ncbi:MAG: Uma2 family endonuclease [Vulcanimicrobiaceae bacterium]|jgi:Uma2 family endonuclease
MSLHEIVLPQTKPETEWVRGRALQKVSGTYDHGSLQGLIAMALMAWSDAGARGRVAMSWRFRVAPPGQVVRPLVPDVAYLSYNDVAADAPDDDVQVPLGAPTVAVEVIVPEERRVDIEDKIATYLAAGTRAVLLVDPRDQSITVDDGAVRVLRPGDVFTHPSLPGFTLDVGALFERARR